MKSPKSSALADHLSAFVATSRANLPGLLLALVLAMASKFVASSYGGPTMLFALLFGMAFNFLSKDVKCQHGIAFSSKVILRIGVAFLGVRLTVGDLSALGTPVVLLVIAGVTVTITGGWAIGRALKLPSSFAVLSAGAVAICGASAALAISAVLPRSESRERNTILVVAGVTAFSTLAMILYPPLAHYIGLNDRDAGIFFGTTIHDVAQVIGAGYAYSDVSGETAAIVKLMRVAALVPAVVIIGLLFKKERGESANGVKTPLLPLFLISFVALVIINSFGFIPAPLVAAISEASRWCLITAVAALGVKTNLGDLFSVGPRPLLALGGQTILLLLFSLAGITLLEAYFP